MTTMGCSKIQQQTTIYYSTNVTCTFFVQRMPSMVHDWLDTGSPVALCCESDIGDQLYCVVIKGAYAHLKQTGKAADFHLANCPSLASNTRYHIGVYKLSNPFLSHGRDKSSSCTIRKTTKFPHGTFLLHRYSKLPVRSKYVSKYGY